MPAIDGVLQMFVLRNMLNEVVRLHSLLRHHCSPTRACIANRHTDRLTSMSKNSDNLLVVPTGGEHHTGQPRTTYIAEASVH